MKGIGPNLEERDLGFDECIWIGTGQERNGLPQDRVSDRIMAFTILMAWDTHIRGFYGRKGFLGLKLLGWMIWMDMR